MNSESTDNNSIKMDPLTEESIKRLKKTIDELDTTSDGESEKGDEGSDNSSTAEEEQMDTSPGYVSPKRVSRKRPISPNTETPTANKYAVLDQGLSLTPSLPNPDVLKTKTVTITEKEEKKSPKIPPITIKNKDKWVIISNQLSIRKIIYTKAKNTPQGIKIEPASADDYRAASKWLKQEGIEFFTYALPDDKPLRVVIRGLPIEVDIEDIKVSLEEEHLQILNIHRLKKFITKTPMPLYLVLLPKNNESKKSSN